MAGIKSSTEIIHCNTNKLPKYYSNDDTSNGSYLCNDACQTSERSFTTRKEDFPQVDKAMQVQIDETIIDSIITESAMIPQIVNLCLTLETANPVKADKSIKTIFHNKTFELFLYRNFMTKHSKFKKPIKNDKDSVNICNSDCSCHRCRSTWLKYKTATIKNSSHLSGGSDERTEIRRRSKSNTRKSSGSVQHKRRSASTGSESNRSQEKKSKSKGENGVCPSQSTACDSSCSCYKINKGKCPIAPDVCKRNYRISKQGGYEIPKECYSKPSESSRSSEQIISSQALESKRYLCREEQPDKSVNRFLCLVPASHSVPALKGSCSCLHESAQSSTNSTSDNSNEDFSKTTSSPSSCACVPAETEPVETEEEKGCSCIEECDSKCSCYKSRYINEFCLQEPDLCEENYQNYLEAGGQKICREDDLVLMDLNTILIDGDILPNQCLKKKPIISCHCPGGSKAGETTERIYVGKLSGAKLMLHPEKLNPTIKIKSRKKRAGSRLADNGETSRSGSRSGSKSGSRSGSRSVSSCEDVSDSNDPPKLKCNEGCTCSKCSTAKPKRRKPEKEPIVEPDSHCKRIMAAYSCSTSCGCIKGPDNVCMIHDLRCQRNHQESLMRIQANKDCCCPHRPGKKRQSKCKVSNESDSEIKNTPSDCACSNKDICDVTIIKGKDEKTEKKSVSEPRKSKAKVDKVPSGCNCSNKDKCDVFVYPAGSKSGEISSDSVSPDTDALSEPRRSSTVSSNSASKKRKLPNDCKCKNKAMCEVTRHTPSGAVVIGTAASAAEYTPSQCGCVEPGECTGTEEKQKGKKRSLEKDCSCNSKEANSKPRISIDSKNSKARISTDSKNSKARMSTASKNSNVRIRSGNEKKYLRAHTVGPLYKK